MKPYRDSQLVIWQAKLERIRGQRDGETCGVEGRKTDWIGRLHNTRRTRKFLRSLTEIHVDGRIKNCLTSMTGIDLTTVLKSALYACFYIHVTGFAELHDKEVGIFQWLQSIYHQHLNRHTFFYQKLWSASFQNLYSSLLSNTSTLLFNDTHDMIECRKVKMNPSSPLSRIRNTTLIFIHWWSKN